MTSPGGSDAGGTAPASAIEAGLPGSAVDRAAPRPPVGLYLHIPFCVSHCPYCDFVVVAGSAAVGPRSRIEAYVEALTAELTLRADALDEAFGPVDAARTDGERRRPLATLYLGGGTPSLLPAPIIARLIDLVRARFGLRPDAEVTLEANPGPDERGDPHALVEAGVTRYSIGAQSLDGELLPHLGRRHRPEDVTACVGGARDAGMPSISIDLLYDVPGQGLGSWLDTLEGAVELAPDHLSLYALTLEDPDADGLTGTHGDHLPLSGGARRWRTAAREQQDEDRAAAQYHAAVSRLAEAGYRGYEISNWARPGHESRHNLAYWRRDPVEAAGPGAHAFDGTTRRWNAARLDGYVGALVPGDGRAPGFPPGGSEPVADDAVESLILGLRLDTGVPLARAFEPPLLGVFGWALAAELLETFEGDRGAGDERIRLTTRGRLLSNELFARLV